MNYRPWTKNRSGHEPWTINYDLWTIHHELIKFRHPAGDVLLYGGNFAAVFVASGLIGLVTQLAFARGFGRECLRLHGICKADGWIGKVHGYCIKARRAAFDVIGSLVKAGKFLRAPGALVCSGLPLGGLGRFSSRKKIFCIFFSHMFGFYKNCSTLEKDYKANIKKYMYICKEKTLKKLLTLWKSSQNQIK